MAADNLKPLGRELAGYEVCPDGVSSAPHPSNSPLVASMCTMRIVEKPSSPTAPNKDERCLLHQKSSLIGGQLKRDPSLTFWVSLMARDGKVRFQMSGVELHSRDAASTGEDR